MSFCADIKNELADIKLKGCCKTALIYGFALFAKSFSAKRICIQTENEKVAKAYRNLLSSVYGVEVNLKKGGVKTPTYIAEVLSESDRLIVLASVDFGIGENVINTDVFYRECCVSSFVRGVFLSCGHLTNPDKGYRVDFYIKNEQLAKDFSELLTSRQISNHLGKVNGGYRVYIKQNEMIVNLLAFMGASALSLQFIEASVIKSVKNKMNRARNCDDANISRTVEASLKQRTAIEYLEKKGRLEALPEKLYSVAVLRKENPELSLKELAKVSPFAITPSGLNHRLNKILEIYEELKA